MRGYQKKVIHLKNPGSAIFEEAFFVLKDDKDETIENDSVIREANRIIEENALAKDGEARRIGFKKILLLLLLSTLTICSVIVLARLF